MKIQTIGDTKLLHKRDVLINIIKEMFPQYKRYTGGVLLGGSIWR